MPDTVVQIVQHLRPGGIETMALDLCRLAPEGSEVHVVSLEGEAPSALADWPRLAPFAGRLHFLDKKAGLRPDTLISLVALLRRLAPTAVHTHHIGPLLYGGLAARLAGVPRLVHTEHDAWHLDDPRRRRLQKILLRLVRPVLVADAAEVARRLRDHIPGAAPRIVRNGVDTDHFRPGDRTDSRRRLGLPEDIVLIGCAARLEPVKGHEILFQAVARLSPNVHLALAGGGGLEAELKGRAENLGIARRVRFLGNLDAMRDFYRALDLFCLASFSEGMPLSPLEAQACGIPCVLTDVGGSRDALCPETGELVPHGDPDRLAEAMSRRLAASTETSPRDFVLRNADLRGVVRAYADLLRAA